MKFNGSFRRIVKRFRYQHSFMVDLDRTERVDRELNVVKRARFNQTIDTYKTNEVPEPKFVVEPHTVKELPA